MFVSDETAKKLGRIGDSKERGKNGSNEGELIEQKPSDDI